MDEFDDVFDDLDDATLAELDAIERNNVPNVQDNRPPKRQKIDHEPIKAGSFDLEDLPEVSVQNDNYSIDMNTIMLQPSNQAQELPARRVQSNDASGIGKKRSAGGIAAPRNQSIVVSSSQSARHDSRPPSRRAGSGSAIRLSAIAAALTGPAPTPTPVPAPAPAPRFEALTEKVDVLQKQLEELRGENERMQNALKEAQDARFAKEGEVTVLRKGVERAAQDHAAQTAKLRTAKEESDSKHLARQKELSEEIERLRTQLVFKQHEEESNSLRRAPVSVRTKRPVVREMSQTITVPPRTPTRNKMFHDSPARLPDSFVATSPSRRMSSVVRRNPISPEKSRKSAVLPGFENAFLDSPSKAKQNSSMQRSRAPAVPPKDLPVPSAPSSQRPISTLQRISFSQISYAPQSTPRPQIDEDVIMDDVSAPPSPMNAIMDQDVETGVAEVEGQAPDESEYEEDVSGVTQLNRKAELTRIMLTHTHPTSKQSALQSFIEWASTPDFPSTQIFSESMSTILETVASVSEDVAFDVSVPTLTRCLVSIFEAFNTANLIQPLTMITNLLAMLLHTFPEFRLSFLTHTASDVDQRPKILVLLSQLIEEQLPPNKHNPLSRALSDDIFDFMEVLIWDAPAGSVKKLSMILCNQALTATLFNNAQPHWLLFRSIRFLALLFSYPIMYQHCIDLATSGLNGDGAKLDLQRLFQLERLCSFLIDTNRCDPDAICMKAHVLMFFAALSVAEPDGLNLLVNSQVLIPSVVTYIAYLTKPIWEEEDEETWDPVLKPASLTTHTLSRAVAVLHYIVNNVQPSVNLRQKFHRSPVRAFNGITHNYIITFGRLAYAPAPEWLNEDSRHHLAGVVEMARDLLEMVVDGPEVDSVWALYQDDMEENEAVDEGEMEESLIGHG
ncbi:rad26 atrip [Moniliophthora roreri MCA 2997]|uniref:Rad26 atrip n=1 Tax=Moniliophthora roreri (strain MCA 2997) TaxID=1381753 RepID=V2YZM5_MONRO|nr:rad26 atrip [Moniliophthora roreri MCA 2997]